MRIPAFRIITAAQGVVNIFRVSVFVKFRVSVSVSIKHQADGLVAHGIHRALRVGFDGPEGDEAVLSTVGFIGVFPVPVVEIIAVAEVIPLRDGFAAFIERQHRHGFPVLLDLRLLDVQVRAAVAHIVDFAAAVARGHGFAVVVKQLLDGHVVRQVNVMISNTIDGAERGDVMPPSAPIIEILDGQFFGQEYGRGTVRPVGVREPQLQASVVYPVSL